MSTTSHAKWEMNAKDSGSVTATRQNNSSEGPEGCHVTIGTSDNTSAVQLSSRSPVLGKVTTISVSLAMELVKAL